MEYKKAYSKERSNVAKARIIFQTAECYRLINDTKQAEIWYFKTIIGHSVRTNEDCIYAINIIVRLNNGIHSC